MIVVSNVITSLNDNEKIIIEKAQKKLKISTNDIIDAFVIKSSIDARHRKMPQFVSSIGFFTNKNEKKYIELLKEKDVSFRENEIELPPFEFGKEKLSSRPVVIGFGPAGMFAGLILAEKGYNPIVFERGNDVDNRVKDVEEFWTTGKLSVKSNVQFGEGGAGTFSDGKLTTRINDPLCEFVLRKLVKFGAPNEIIRKAKPHIGTDNLRNVVKNIKTEIIRLGGEVHNFAQLTDIQFDLNNNLAQIKINDSPIPCSALILAIGHSARDTFEMLISKSIAVEVKPFSIGVRIEHLQSEINKGLYGKYSNHPLLPQGEYQLSLRDNGRAVYTFCMCPGGLVVPSSSESETVVTNGMSEFARDRQNANSALVVSVSQNDFGNNPHNAIEFQRKYEKIAFITGGKNYSAPAQTVGSFLNNKMGLEINRVNPSYSFGVKACNFKDVFPKEISDMLQKGLVNFNTKINGFSSSDAVLTGIETRTSSPIRIIRNENCQSISVKGLYPCGEGAGYAGGIMSAAVDGIRCAIELMKKYKKS